jgi:hypothetical protein
MFMPRNGMIAGSTLLLAAVLAGCSDQTISSPIQRSPGARASVIVPVVTTWDFAALWGTPGPADLGTTHTFTNGSNGSIVASSTDRHVSVKGQEALLTDAERGLGLCLHAGGGTCVFPADGDEVGDGGAGTLLINFNAVAPAGSIATAVSLGSLQTGEGYRMSISTNGGSSYTVGPFDVVPNTPGDITDVSLNGGTGYPTANLVIKFEKSTTSTCLPTCDDDYTVRTVTTQFTPPSTIWCSPGFYKNHGRDLWTNLQSQTYNELGVTLGGWPNDPQSFLITAPKKGGSTDPTLIQVIDNPQQYGGPATNNVADYLNHLFFGTPFSDQPENCPDVLPFVS